MTTLYQEVFSLVGLRERYDEIISKSKAVGLDGITNERFEESINDNLDIILRKVGNCSYKFTKYKQKLILKGPNRPPRVISIATIRDRLVLRALNDILAKSFPEAIITKPHAIIKAVTDSLVSAGAEKSFVRVDVVNFFPTINRDMLLEKVNARIKEKNLMHLIRAAISNKTAGFEDYGVGVPQGLSISNILSSIYLIEMDQKLDEKYQYYRYVDDILVVCESDAANNIFDNIREELCLLGLKCHDIGSLGNKSGISQAPNGTDYLGFHITPNTLSVRSSSYNKMIDTILTLLTVHRHLQNQKSGEQNLLWSLNLKITGCIYKGKRYGWLFFFSQINNLQQLGRLDSFVSREMDRRGLGHLLTSKKRFVKSYHEIRYNLRQTLYVPNFDNYDTEKMIKELMQAEGQNYNHYRQFTNDDIEKKFHFTVRRVTQKLEQDLIELS